MNEIIIPQQYEAFGTTINVITSPVLAYRNGTNGEERTQDHTIEIQSSEAAYPVPSSEVELTFFHEYFHKILSLAGYPKLSNNEDLVQRLAQLHHQYEKSKAGRLL